MGRCIPIQPEVCSLLLSNGLKAVGPGTLRPGMFPTTFWAFRTSVEKAAALSKFSPLPLFLCRQDCAVHFKPWDGKHPSALMPYFPQACMSK